MISKREFESYASMVSEGYKRIYPAVPIFVLDRSASKPDALLNESENKVYKPIQYVQCHVQWNPKVHDLNKFGIEDTQDVILTFSSYDLQQHEIKVEELSNSVVLLTNDKTKKQEQFQIRTAYQLPSDAIGWGNAILNVAVTLNLRERGSLISEDNLELGMVKPQERASFFSEREIKARERMLLEGYNRTMPKLPILALDRGKTQVDEILQETISRVFKSPVDVPGYATWQPPYFTLGKFGIETEQEVLILFSELALKEAGFEDLDELVGSLIMLQLDMVGTRRHFEIQSVHKQPEDSASPYGDILNVAITVTLYEHNSNSNDIVPDAFDMPWNALESEI